MDIRVPLITCREVNSDKGSVGHELMSAFGYSYAVSHQSRNTS